MFSTKLSNRLVVRQISRAIKLPRHQTLHRSAIVFASDVPSKETDKKDESGSISTSVKPRANVPFTKELFLGRFDKVILYILQMISQ